MVTTKRSLNNTNQSFTSSSASCVGLLEREEIQEVNNIAVEESLEEAKIRMQRNLDNLLNYDRYSATVVEDDAPVQEEIASVVNSTISPVEEDIRPTSTTMQFGDGDVQQMYNEMPKSEEKASYRLNSKGKLLLVLYSLAVTVILALIILNTGVLSTLKDTNANKQNELASLMSETASIEAEINDISSDEYIGAKAEELGMSLR